MNTFSEKIIFLSIAFVVGLGIGFYATKVIDRSVADNETPSQSVNSFADCVAAGNPVMESYPRQCRSADGRLFVEEIDVPIPNPDDETFCTTQYDPVCGEVQVQCIKAPCPPIKETFSNTCFAAKAGAFNVVPGECE